MAVTTTGEKMRDWVKKLFLDKLGETELRQLLSAFLRDKSIENGQELRRAVLRQMPPLPKRTRK